MESRQSQGVLITGASRSLGLATALETAKAGFHVWAGARRSESFEDIRKAAAGAGVEIEPISLDVNCDESVEAAFQTIEAAPQRLYGVVNNAAITGRAHFELFPEDFARRIFETNVFGPMRVTRRALPVLRRAGRGRVILISSVAGKFGSVGLAPYVSSKFAIEGFGESLYLEMKPFGIETVIIEPGITKSDIWDEQSRILPEAKDPSTAYFEIFQRSEKLTEKMVSSSKIQQSDIGQTVVKALTAGNPKLRYVVGRRARFTMALRRHLPGELFERIYFGEFLRRITKKD